MADQGQRREDHRPREKSHQHRRRFDLHGYPLGTARSLACHRPSRRPGTEGVCWTSDANLPITAEAAEQSEREFFSGWLSVSLQKPQSGEARADDDAEHFSYVRQACIEFAAGSVAERIVWPDEKPLDA